MSLLMKKKLINRSVDSEEQSSGSVEEEQKSKGSSKDEVKVAQPETTKRTGCFDKFNLAAIRLTFSLKGKEFYSSTSAKVIFITGIIAGLIALVHLVFRMGEVDVTTTQVLPAVPLSEVQELYFPGGVSHTTGNSEAKMTNLTRLAMWTPGNKVCESLRKQVNETGKKWEQSFGVHLIVLTTAGVIEKPFGDQPLDCHSIPYKFGQRDYT